jgi:curli production assembly/transport component CsgG/holdfast attachment protein HfaB
MRTVVINVALDARVVNSRNFAVVYARSLQKQIYGFEVEANVFRFFGDTLVEFDAGSVRNEPLQIGVRSVVEMFVYGMLTEGFGLPTSPECELVSLEYPYTLEAATEEY